MKFNLRESVPILNRDAPITTKIAALVFLISFSMSLHLLVSLISATHLLSLENISISPKISGDSLRRLMLFTVAVIAAWVLANGLLIANLFFRRRWAKNVLSVMTLLIFFAILFAHSVHPENASTNLSNNLEHVAEVVAVILLFTPKSTAWFRFRA
ncbi:hypothetical protein [Paraburkholderia ultramafica]|nr:hypothetical protein [Paraburkholderia ultramafica]